MRNPFSKTVLGDKEPFCNQTEILAALMLEARSGNNNVLLAPRRAGKTTLAYRLARDYRNAGGVVSIADLSAVPSADAAAERIAIALFAALSLDKKIFQRLASLIRAYLPVVTMNPDGTFTISVSASGAVRGGIDRLVSVVGDLDKVSDKFDIPLLVVLDEFQDLALLKDGEAIEAALRTTIQHQKASYLFIGSRRKILRDMFESPKRAFYRGATVRNLPLINSDEFSEHLVAVVAASGAAWDRNITDDIVATVACHTYSVTAIAHTLFEMTAPKSPSNQDLLDAINDTLDRESSQFMAIYAGLTPQVRTLLQALAAEPTQHPMAGDYMSKHRLSNAGTVKKSLATLITEDHIERDESGLFNLTDPLMRLWLNNRLVNRQVRIELF
ncbi:hypothetical protein OR1_02685 [Geobacter sp. OR-1]|uniref:ATP-binding protein n=1 Tax=Geobacter sp. OR-1 TaxID=1266765 RepID=UPI0005426E4A|nr:ATP-binding protein [Geobacter sp. OR-1]GAM10396.1 hypothetical protein OR1_02685 [Geobacter sp. OR-1]